MVPFGGNYKCVIRGIHGIKQYNIVIDVLGGYSRDVSQALRDLVGEASSKVARRMQKSVISSTLHVARYVKIIQS